MHRLVLCNDRIRYVCLDQEWQTTVLIQSTRVEVFHCYWLQSKGQGSPRESPDEWLKSSLHRSIFDLCFKGSTRCPVALLILFLFRISEVFVLPTAPKKPFLSWHGVYPNVSSLVWCCRSMLVSAKWSYIAFHPLNPHSPAGHGVLEDGMHITLLSPIFLNEMM